MPLEDKKGSLPSNYFCKSLGMQKCPTCIIRWFSHHILIEALSYYSTDLIHWLPRYYAVLQRPTLSYGACVLTCLPVAARNALTRGMTCGTIPLPSVIQDHPTVASATCYSEHTYASIHKFFVCPSHVPMATIVRFPYWLRCRRARHWMGGRRPLPH